MKTTASHRQHVSLTVLSAGKCFSLFVAKHTLDTIEHQQQELAQLSPGKQIIAQQSGRYIQHSQPDLVIAAIR